MLPAHIPSKSSKGGWKTQRRGKHTIRPLHKNLFGPTHPMIRFLPPPRLSSLQKWLWKAHSIVVCPPQNRMPHSAVIQVLFAVFLMLLFLLTPFFFLTPSSFQLLQFALVLVSAHGRRNGWSAAQIDTSGPTVTRTPPLSPFLALSFRFSKRSTIRPIWLYHSTPTLQHLHGLTLLSSLAQVASHCRSNLCECRQRSPST